MLLASSDNKFSNRISSKILNRFQFSQSFSQFCRRFFIFRGTFSKFQGKKNIFRPTKQKRYPTKSLKRRVVSPKTTRRFFENQCKLHANNLSVDENLQISRFSKTLRIDSFRPTLQQFQMERYDKQIFPNFITCQSAYRKRIGLHYSCRFSQSEQLILAFRKKHTFIC